LYNDTGLSLHGGDKMALRAGGVDVVTVEEAADDRVTIKDFLNLISF